MIVFNNLKFDFEIRGWAALILSSVFSSPAYYEYAAQINFHTVFQEIVKYGDENSQNYLVLIQKIAQNYEGILVS